MDSKANNEPAAGQSRLIWSAPAERGGDGALDMLFESSAWIASRYSLAAALYIAYSDAL